MKNKIKPFALIWILLICILPSFKNLNPFINLTLSILPLIIGENWKKIFPPTPFIIVFIFTYLLLLLSLLLFLCESYFHDLPEEGQCPQYHDGIANHAKPTQIL